MKLQYMDPPVCATTPTGVKQTLDDIANIICSVPNAATILAATTLARITIGSPVGNHNAITAMTARGMDHDPAVGEGQAYTNERLYGVIQGKERKERGSQAYPHICLQLPPSGIH
jgi:hypothetical protein